MLTYFYAAIITMATTTGTEIHPYAGIFETQAQCEQSIARHGVKSWDQPPMVPGWPKNIVQKEEGVTECTKLETPLPDAVVAQDVPFIDSEDERNRNLVRQWLYQRQFYSDMDAPVASDVKLNLESWRFRIAEAHGLLNPGTPKLEKDQVIPFK